MTGKVRSRAPLLREAIIKGSYSHEKGGGVIYFSRQRQAPPIKETMKRWKKKERSRPRAEERSRTNSIMRRNIIREKNEINPNPLI